MTRNLNTAQILIAKLYEDGLCEEDISDKLGLPLETVIEILGSYDDFIADGGELDLSDLDFSEA